MTTILVTGPETSGNRMLCRMLIESGANVLHKPMPMTHAIYPQDVDGVWTSFSELEWDAAVIIHRDLYCTLNGQVAAGHVKDIDHAIRRTREALSSIYAQLAVSGRPFWPVTYESLARPEAVNSLCLLLDLPGVPTTKWEDANAKYYGGPVFQDHRRLDRVSGGNGL